MTHGPHDKYGVSVGRLGPVRRVPVMDDTALGPVWTDPHDDTSSRRYWMDQYQEQLALTQALRSDLSTARFERDIWWPIGFCVGVICGLGLGWWLV